MAEAHWHPFQVLTKERLEALNSHLQWPENVWMGVSVESATYQYRLAHLPGREPESSSCHLSLYLERSRGSISRSAPKSRPTP